MHKPIKYVEKGLMVAAKGAWAVFDTLNSIKPNGSFTPNWSVGKLRKPSRLAGASAATQ